MLKKCKRCKHLTDCEWVSKGHEGTCGGPFPREKKVDSESKCSDCVQLFNCEDTPNMHKTCSGPFIKDGESVEEKVERLHSSEGLGLYVAKWAAEIEKRLDALESKSE